MHRWGLKRKLIVPILSIILFTGTILIVLLLIQLRTIRNNSIYNFVVEKESEMARSVRTGGETALLFSALFKDVPSVIDAYSIANSGKIDNERDSLVQQGREKLRKDLKPVLSGYKAVLGEPMQVHFHLKNGRSFVRLWREHQIKKNGEWVDISDDIAPFRPMVTSVARSQKSVSGIEVGQGGFAVRGVMPIVQNGTFLGSVEMLSDYDKIIASALDSTQEVMLCMDKSLLSIAGALQDTSKYPIIGDQFVVASGKSTSDIASRMPADLLRRGFEKMAIAYNSSPVFAAFPVRDFRNESVGVIAFTVDSKQIDSSIVSIRRASLILSVAMIILILFILSISMNKTVNALTSVAEQLMKSANFFKQKSDQLSESSQLLAQGVSEQATSLEEVSINIEELSAMTQQNATNSQEANALGKMADNDGKQCITIVKNMAITMEEIQSSSDKSAQIIKTIDEIAMQTNLLALNAAIEAARAGESGRGFAVVAEEVRNLALRSAEAAKSTSVLIDSMQSSSHYGVKVASEVESAISGIADTVSKMSQLLSEVSEGSAQQASGLELISATVHQLEEVTQSTAVTSEETATSGEDLNNQAHVLAHIVDQLSVMVEGESAASFFEDSLVEIERSH